MLDSTLCPPSRTVVSAVLSFTPGKIACDARPPLMEMLPAGAKIPPSMSTVSPLSETLARASVRITAPSTTTRSPRTCCRLLNGSKTPGALNVRLTGVRTPSCWSTACSAKSLSGVSRSASQLFATGAIRVPGAMVMPGVFCPPAPAGRPVPLITNPVKPPWLKKSGSSSSVSRLVVVPPA